MAIPSTFDAVIIASLPFELDALLHQGKGWIEIADKHPSVRACYWTKALQGASVLAVLLPGYGRFAAAGSAQHLIARWRPSLLGLVGTAGGLGIDVELGDMVVASRIVDYEVHQTERDRQGFQWSVYEPSPSFLSRVSRLQGTAWQHAIHVARPDGRTVETSRALIGSVLSSNRVIASAAERAQVRSTWPRVAAVEMEAAGLAAAAQASGMPVSLLLFRGICDLADESKDDRWREYAASTAAAFAWAYLDSFDPLRELPVADPQAPFPDTTVRGVPLTGVKYALDLAFDLGQLKQLASHVGFDVNLLSPSSRNDPGVALIEHLSRQRQDKLVRLIEQMRHDLLESFSLGYVNCFDSFLARASAMKNKLLFLAANPASSSRLALDNEVRDIEQRLLAAKHRDLFEFKTMWAVQPQDLQDALLREEPTIVHFSGHGSGVSGIVLHSAKEDEVKLVAAEALRHLFSTLKGNIRIVVLNACYSQQQAEAIVEEIDVVIGMKDSIGDEAARVFASSFYRGLGFGKSVKTAFELGVGAIKLEGLIGDDDVPVMVVRQGVDASRVILAVGASNDVGGQPMMPERSMPERSMPERSATEVSDLVGKALESPFGMDPLSLHASPPVGLKPSPPVGSKPLSSPITQVQEETVRRIFRMEIDEGHLDRDAVLRVAEGLFDKGKPGMGASTECILLLRAMRAVANLQRLAHPKSKYVEWAYTHRLLEVTESILAEQGYDLESLAEIAKEALKSARAKRFLQFKDEDEWRPGMVSGTGWVEYACLSTIGEKLLERLG